MISKAEKRFVDAQKVRRELNTTLLKSQQKLRNLRDEMDRLSRKRIHFTEIAQIKILLLNFIYLLIA
jgi:hypothetical protein